MDDFFGFLVTVGAIVIAIYANKKKKERRSEELKKAEEERKRKASLSQNNHKSSSNDIVRRRKENEKAAQEIQKRRLENEKAATAINNRRVEQQAEADSTRIHSSLHEKEEKFDFEDQDLMQEVYDLMAYGCDGSDFLRRLEKENHFQSSLDATINA